MINYRRTGVFGIGTESQAGITTIIVVAWQMLCSLKLVRHVYTGNALKSA